MAEKNSLWKNIREKAERNRRTGAKPRKPTTEMLRQERKIKSQHAKGGPVGEDGKEPIAFEVTGPTYEVVADNPNSRPNPYSPASLKDFFTFMNPMNWGLNDYSNVGNFDKAYSKARANSEKEFIWNNKRFNTDMAGTPAQQLQWSGITNDRLGIQGDLERRAYNTVKPSIYDSEGTASNINNFIKGNNRFENITDKVTPLIDSLLAESNKPVELYNKEKADAIRKQLDELMNRNFRGEDDPYSEDAWRIYLGKPQTKNTFGISNYIPSIGKETNINYYSLPKSFKEELFNLYNNKKIKEGVNSEFAFENVLGENASRARVLGNFTVNKGKDDKGEYISYYDKYDLNPDLPIVGEFFGGLDNFVGKPFEIYDRIYIDPKTGKPITEKAEGGYFPTQGPPKALFKGYAEGGYMYPGGGYTGPGGPGGLGSIKPTRQDSLMLFNNALEKIKFYKGNPDYERIPLDRNLRRPNTSMGHTNFKDPSLRKTVIEEVKKLSASDKKVKQQRVQETIKAAADANKPLTPLEIARLKRQVGTDRFGKVPNTNLTSFGDILLGGSDDIYNPLAPPIYLHPNITPQGSESYESGRFGDMSDIPYYDPLAIAPFDKLTPEQQEKRVEKYGDVGVPKSYLESRKKDKDSTTTDTSVIDRTPVQLDKLESLKLTNLPTQETPLNLNLSNTEYKEPFKPSRVVLREMGNISRYNNNEPYKATHEMYMDDDKQWRPITKAEHEMYSKQYPGSDEPLGWTGKKEKATGGPTINNNQSMKNNSQSWKQYLQYAQGGPYKEKEDVFTSPLNEGQTMFKPETQWYKDWINDPEYAARMENNFKAPNSGDFMEGVGLGNVAENYNVIENKKGIKDLIDTTTGNLGNIKTLYNRDPTINESLIDTYKNKYKNDPEALKKINKNLAKKHQGWTDPENRIIITPNANEMYGASSVKVHEDTHATGLDAMFKGKFKPTSSKDPEVIKDFRRVEQYPFLMQMRHDQGFKPGEEITPERLKQIRESGYQNHLFKNYSDDELSNYLNTLASNTGQQSNEQYAARGGYTNPYNQYQDDPYLQYKVGGKVWQDIGAGAYGVLEGTLGTVTGGLTDPLMDKGYDALQKAANKNFDPNNPEDVKAMREIDTVGGSGQIAGGWLGLTVNPANVGSAVAETGSGANKIVQSSTASDSAKQWSQGISGVMQMGHSMNGMGSASSSGSTPGSSAPGSSATAGAAGKGTSSFGDTMANFSGSKFGKSAKQAMPYVNQAAGMLGGNNGSLLQQGVARQDYLSSPEYLELQRQGNVTVNQGINFSQGGNITNNSLNLRNTMRNKRFAQGGTLEQQGINFITDDAGFHHQSANGGVPIGPGALAEGGEAKLQMADGGQYIVSDQVDGANTQTINGQTMAERLKKKLQPFMMGGLASNPKDKDNLRRPFDSYSAESIAQVKDNAIQETEAVRMQRGGAVQYAANGGKLNKDIEKIVMEEYSAAYGDKLPNKYKGKVNMPNSYAKGGIHINESKKGTFTAAATKHGKGVQEFAKQVLAHKENYSPGMVKKANFAHNAAGWKHADGGYVHNQMTQPMLAEGGPSYPKPSITNAQVQKYVDDMNERGMTDPGKQFQTTWQSDLQNRAVDLGKELNSTDLERVKSLYNFRQQNKNPLGFAEGGPIYGDPASPYTYAYGGAYGDPYYRGGQIDYTNDMYSSYAGGGPMVSNVPQAFKGPAAQNRGGMYIYADGGMMPPEQQMMQEQQQAPQEQMQQQSGQEQMMQMVQQVAQAIMQGENPEQLMAELANSGMPQEQVQQVMQAAMQMADQQQQQQPMQGQEQMQPQQGMMARGGRMRYDGGGTFGPITETEAIANGYQPSFQDEIDYTQIPNFNTPIVTENLNSLKLPTYSTDNLQLPNNKLGTPLNLTGWKTPDNSIEGPWQPGVSRPPLKAFNPNEYSGDETTMPDGTTFDGNVYNTQTPIDHYYSNQDVLTGFSNKYPGDSANTNSVNKNADTPWSEEPWYSKAARYSQAIPGIAATITGLKNKKRHLTPDKMAAQTVNYEPERIVDREESRRALDSGLRTMRGSAPNARMLAGNTTNAILNANKGLAGRISESVMREKNTNAQLAQQAAGANFEAGNQFKQLNEGMFQNAQTQALAGLQDTFGSKLPGAAQEERKQYLQEWIARNRLKTRNYSTANSGQDVYHGTDGHLYDSEGNMVG